jgi:hypothetical protein
MRGERASVWDIHAGENTSRKKFAKLLEVAASIALRLKNGIERPQQRS